MNTRSKRRVQHKRYMSAKTFTELTESLRQALKYERGERAGFRVTYASGLKKEMKAGEKKR